MPKKAGAKRKKTSRKKTTRKRTPKKSVNSDVENILVQNFISLQKVMTNLAIKFDELNMQISKLLELFEISAKTLAQKDIQLDRGKTETRNESKMVEKLDVLLDQNKIIARSLTLLHEPSQTPPQQMMQPMPQHLMQQPMPSPHPMQQTGGGYQKSMSIQSTPVKERHYKKLKKSEEKDEESVF